MDTANCIYCNSCFGLERFQIGFNYCLEYNCQKLGIKAKQEAFLSEYTPALLHKSNYFWVKKSELKMVNVRSDLESYGM